MHCRRKDNGWNGKLLIIHRVRFNQIPMAERNDGNGQLICFVYLQALLDRFCYFSVFGSTEFRFMVKLRRIVSVKGTQKFIRWISI